MITLTAKIELIGNDSGEINNITSAFTGNNISCDIDDIKGVTSQKTVSPFLLGKSKFSEDHRLYNKLSYFMTFNEAFSFSVESASDISFLTIEFDTTNDRYPAQIYINNTKYEVTSSVFTVDVENSTELNIDITDTSYQPVILTGVYTNVTIKLDYTNLISISRTIYDRDNTKFPSFGVISNIADIEFNDFSLAFLNYAEQNLLIEGLSCDIILGNNITGNTERIGSYKTNQWEYDNDNHIVSVSLKDELEEWQDIHIAGFSYDARVQVSKTLKEYYNYLYERTPAKYNMLAFDLLDDATKSVLTNTIVKYPLLESSSLWQQWDKLAKAAQSHIFKTNEGKTTFVYNGGN